MPAPYLAQLPKSRSAEEFELMCCDVLQKRCSVFFQQYGRNGQKQNGIDLYAPSPQSIGYYIVAQCKNYFGDSTPSTLISKIKADIAAVAQQTILPIQQLYIMTSFNRDVQIQNTIINQQVSCPFQLVVMFWEDIQREILHDQTLLAKYYSYIGNGNLVTLFNLAFIGTQFSYLIFLLLGDRGETNRICELLQDGVEWIKNINARQRFSALLSGVYEFVNGDLPYDILDNPKNSDQHFWCTEVEKIVSTAGDSLEPKTRILFMIGAHLGHYSKAFGMNDTVVLPANEKDCLMGLCHSYGFTSEQNQNIEQLLEPMFLPPPDFDTALPLESYSAITRKIQVPDKVYEYIRNLLMRS